MREHMRKKNPLIGFNAVLVALRLFVLRCDLRARWCQSWNEGCGRIGEFLGAHEVRLIFRQRRVHGLHMPAEKRLAALAADVQDRFSGTRLVWSSLWLVRQRAAQLVTLEPEFRMPIGVALEVPGEGRM